VEGTPVRIPDSILSDEALLSDRASKSTSDILEGTRRVVVTRITRLLLIKVAFVPDSISNCLLSVST